MNEAQIKFAGIFLEEAARCTKLGIKESGFKCPNCGENVDIIIKDTNLAVAICNCGIAMEGRNYI